MLNRLWRAVITLAALMGIMLGAAGAAGASATATCSQLDTKLKGLWSRYSHVVDEDAKQKILDQIDAVEAQMEAQGCFNDTARTFTGTVRIWTDNDLAPGPYEKPISFQVHISPTGSVGWALPTVTFDSSGVTIKQQQSSGQSASGSYNAGAMSLTAPIGVDTRFGSATGTLDVSTDRTVNTRSGSVSGSRVGSAADMSGAVTMVGTTPLTISVVHLNAQVELIGTLS